MRLRSKAKIVERVTIKIKIFDTGKWDWTVKQRFIKEPQIQVDDILSILDEIKTEILVAEGRPPLQQPTQSQKDNTPTSSS